MSLPKVELQVGEDARHFEGMREIRVAGGAGLQAVRLHGEDIGSVQSVFVGSRIIGFDPFDKFELANHLARSRT
jgi:hypothetical protein